MASESLVSSKDDLAETTKLSGAYYIHNKISSLVESLEKS